MHIESFSGEHLVSRWIPVTSGELSTALARTAWQKNPRHATSVRTTPGASRQDLN